MAGSFDYAGPTSRVTQVKDVYAARLCPRHENKPDKQVKDELQQKLMNYFDKFPQYKYKIDNKHLTINGRKMNIRYITFVEHIELQLLTLEEYHILESTHLEYELRRAEQSAPTDHPLPSYDTPAPPAVTSPTAISDMYVKGCYLGSKECDRDLKQIADSGNHLAEGFYSLVYHVGGAETVADDDRAAHYSNRALSHLSTSSSREAMFCGWSYLSCRNRNITRCCLSGVNVPKGSKLRICTCSVRTWI